MFPMVFHWLGLVQIPTIFQWVDKFSNSFPMVFHWVWHVFQLFSNGFDMLSNGFPLCFPTVSTGFGIVFEWFSNGFDRSSNVVPMGLASFRTVFQWFSHICTQPSPFLICQHRLSHASQRVSGHLLNLRTSVTPWCFRAGFNEKHGISPPENGDMMWFEMIHHEKWSFNWPDAKQVKKCNVLSWEYWVANLYLQLQ